MLYMLLMCMMLILMLPLMKHPLSMGFLLILQTVLVAMITGLINNNMFMMSYILFIIMLSGALVLFIYMASVASNEKFKTSIKMLFMIMSVFIFMLLIYYKNDEVLMNSHSYNFYNPMIEYNQNMLLNSLYNNQAMYLTMMAVLYLLFTMISVTYIVNIFDGPMRKMS
uniref:NADH-ubiquinone oxidoreductase chain 6 n=1 Tax=Gorpis annulatus TaxID=696245 RepID=K7NBH2_9HEMI|nr:NADH dehydrogenase subunit 6 [Gorpis annulatus]AEI53352.1 NADH dehydrogenase subunit 6 [Gorpis annulatus]